MRINQNIAAFNSYRNLSATNNAMGKSLEKLSSGFRINRAADDAAGLVISQGLRAQVSGLKQATRNAQDGISVVQTAEGALNEVHSMLNRMRDLAVQSVNASNDQAARTAANEEITQLKEEITRIGETTKFGSVNLLNGDLAGTDATAASGALGTAAGADFSSTNLTFDITVDGGSAQSVTLNGNYADADAFVTALNGAVTGATFSVDGSGNLAVASDTTGASSSVVISGTTGGGGGFQDLAEVTGADASGGALFQVGANQGETIRVSISDITSLDTAGDVLTAANAETFIATMDSAIASVSTVRGELGAVQNRFESTISNLQVTTENLAASESRIRDTDMALEMVSFTRHQILAQAGTSMLAQANQVPQSVLSLLR